MLGGSQGPVWPQWEALWVVSGSPHPVLALPPFPATSIFSMEQEVGE